MVKSNRSFYAAVMSVSTAFLLLLITTRCSPLYPMNDWVDVNAFFTMGKGMMSGRVPYRDLFEQKGPLLYFLHGLAYRVSARSHIGIFFIEIISFSAFLFICYQIAALFADRTKAMLAIPILGAVILNSPAMSLGDSVEELSLALFAGGLYLLLRYFKQDYPNAMPMLSVFAAGILAGCTLWLKYSLLGFWFGWILMIFIAMLYRKHYKQAFTTCFVYLAGMAIASLPWLLYFGLNGAIYEMFDVYFLVNALYYPSEVSLALRVPVMLWYFLKHSVINLPFTLLTGIGIRQLLRGKMQIGRLGRLAVLACMGFLMLGVFGGAREYTYYYLIFAPFAVLGMPFVCSIKPFKKLTATGKAFGIRIGTSVLAAFVLTAVVNMNMYTFLGTKKDSMAQYKFAEVINSTPNATLLNYGYLDYGFFTTTGIVPSVRIFENQNIPYEAYPLIMDEQNRYVRNKVVDYVVIRIPFGNDPYAAADESLYENYELVMRHKQTYRNNKYEFLLFQLKN